MNIFSNRIKDLREKRKEIDSKWTQEYIANILGVARVTYTAYESGTKQPPLETVDKLADIFEVTTDYLLGRTDNPKILSENKTADEQLKELLSDPQMRVAFRGYENWSEADKQELLNYLKVKNMSRELNNPSK